MSFISQTILLSWHVLVSKIKNRKNPDANRIVALWFLIFSDPSLPPIHFYRPPLVLTSLELKCFLSSSPHPWLTRHLQPPGGQMGEMTGRLPPKYCEAALWSDIWSWIYGEQGKRNMDGDYSTEVWHPTWSHLASQDTIFYPLVIRDRLIHLTYECIQSKFIEQQLCAQLCAQLGIQQWTRYRCSLLSWAYNLANSQLHV